MEVMANSDMHGQLEGIDPGDAELVLVAGDFAPLKGWSHIHTGDHEPVVLDHGDSKTTVFNVSRLDEDYEVAYEPLRLEINTDSARKAAWPKHGDFQES